MPSPPGARDPLDASAPIATRKLKLRDGAAVREIPIALHRPEEKSGSWICRFEIGWPDGNCAQWGAGADSIQALFAALQIIGVLIYTSTYHNAGQLSWYENGAGYGFPVTNNVRHLLTGHDAAYF